MKRIVVALVALFALASCTHINGMVVAKEYHKAWDDTVMTPQYRTDCSYNPTTKSNMCRQVFVGVFPVTTHHDECFEITVEQDDDGSRHSTCIDEIDWKELSVGSHYEEKS